MLNAMSFTHADMPFTHADVFEVVEHLAPVLAVVIAAIFNHKKLQEVHLLVNSRLDKALAKITSLERSLREAKDPRECSST